MEKKMNEGKDLTIKINGHEITANQKVLRVISDSLMNGGVKMHLREMFDNPKKYQFDEVYDHKIIEKIKDEVVKENKNQHLGSVLDCSVDRQINQIDSVYEHNRLFKDSFHNDSGSSDDLEEMEQDRFDLLLSRTFLLEDIIFSYRKIIEQKLSY